MAHRPQCTDFMHPMWFNRVCHGTHQVKTISPAEVELEGERLWLADPGSIRLTVKWIYFKRYEIGPEEDSTDLIIRYLDGGTLRFGYGTSADLKELFERYSADIPVYDWTEPPSSGGLELISPEKMIEACDKILADEDLDEKKGGYIQKIRELSAEGYFIVSEFE